MSPSVYPQLAENIGADNLTIHFTPTEEEIIFVTKGASDVPPFLAQ